MTTDRPASETREAILNAFNRLVLSSRRARPPVAQLLREAGVARSTLYKHFDDREQLLLEAMGGPLSIIANCAFGNAHSNQLVGLLDHFWDQRRAGGDVLSGHFATRLVRSLAVLITERAPELDRHDAIRIADTQIGFVRLWIFGETPCSSAALADKMIAAARAQRNALVPER
jgi:AcrR family transcriptional regulator